MLCGLGLYDRIPTVAVNFIFGLGPLALIIPLGLFLLSAVGRRANKTGEQARIAHAWAIRWLGIPFRRAAASLLSFALTATLWGVATGRAGAFEAATLAACVAIVFCLASFLAEELLGLIRG